MPGCLWLARYSHSKLLFSHRLHFGRLRSQEVLRRRHILHLYWGYETTQADFGTFLTYAIFRFGFSEAAIRTSLIESTVSDAKSLRRSDKNDRAQRIWWLRIQSARLSMPRYNRASAPGDTAKQGVRCGFSSVLGMKMARNDSLCFCLPRII